MSNDKKIAKIAEYGQKGKLDKITKFASSKEADLRAAAVEALGNFNSDDAYNEVVLLIRDPDMNVRISAVKALGKIGRKAGADHIRYLMEREKDPNFLKVAQDAVSAIQKSPHR